MNAKKEYLGDSVYVEHDGCDLVLTTENGSGPSNIIILEPAVYAALARYVEALNQTASATPHIGGV